MKVVFVLLLACAVIVMASGQIDYCPGVKCPAVLYKPYPSEVSECWFCLCYKGILFPRRCDPGMGFDPVKEMCTLNDNC